MTTNAMDDTAIKTARAIWWRYAWKNLRTAVRLVWIREWSHGLFALRAAVGWVPGLGWLDR